MKAYALSVCFIAVIGVVISTAIAGYSIFMIIAPEFALNSYDYENYQSNDSYWESISSRSKEKERPGKAELTRRRREAFAGAVKAEKMEGIQSLIYSLMFTLAAGITLLIHWKIARKAKEEDYNQAKTGPN